jgi:cell division protein FtsQ
VNTKKTIRKILFIALWVAIGGGMITLLAAAMRNQKNQRCSGYNIVIKGGKENLFVDESDIRKMLGTVVKGNIKDQPRSAFDLRKMEQTLEDNVWISDAELYFDNKDVLQVTIKERQPIARVFTTAGKSFYVDLNEKRMPLSDKISARLPVFTGFPEKKLLTPRDSILLHDIKITKEREFEMIPLVGNHVVKLGNGSDMERKFNRLYIFYKNILSKTGFDKYKTIDVQYTGQVVGTRGFSSKVDSIQLRKNVEKLLQQARALDFDSAAPVRRSMPDPELSAETAPGRGDDSVITVPVRRQ